MQTSLDLTSSGAPGFPSSRAGALERLREFVPRAGRYARDRNKVLPGHPNVSRLSPAIRHRLITEAECAAAPLERYAPSTVEKFTQEVYWRRYWKAWLSLRPQVWSGYLADLEALRHEPEFEDARTRAAACEAARGPIDLMNYFARELVETDYLHNHARMWFAGWWVHVERLPWQLGADFFYRHLLDADPASNTLSWRWVAGLQTPGKTYLPRRSNIEKYVDPEILGSRTGGLELLEQPEAFLGDVPPRPEVTQATRPEEPALEEDGVGIWIHEEDLLPEESPLAPIRPAAIQLAGHGEAWRRFRLPARREEWLRSALADARIRAERHFDTEADLVTDGPLAEGLGAWATRHGLRQVAALRPETGPLADDLDGVRRALAECGATLTLLDRPEDVALRPLATGGFFSFWKKFRSASDA
ncbi:MAG: hypothetical protein HKN82_18385 [Akkermansiaceae bacterium]|nr:hypothetical protein [Akkermansiaceae bacterium]